LSICPLHEWIAGNGGFIAGNESLIAGNESLIAGNESLIAGNESLIAGNESLIAGNESLIAGNEGFIAGNESLIAGNEGFIAGNESLIAGYEDLSGGYNSVSLLTWVSTHSGRTIISLSSCSTAAKQSSAVLGFRAQAQADGLPSVLPEAILHTFVQPSLQHPCAESVYTGQDRGARTAAPGAVSVDRTKFHRHTS
jgi:hypothetical protein